MTTERQRRNAPFTVGDRVCQRWNTDCRGTVTYCEYASSPGFSYWAIKVRIDGEAEEAHTFDAARWRDLAALETFEAKPAHERLKIELARHDWYHSMSDSNDVHRRGQAHLEKIIELARECNDPERVRTLWEATKPKDCRIPPRALENG